jgi:hypothetical protein
MLAVGNPKGVIHKHGRVISALHSTMIQLV